MFSDMDREMFSAQVQVPPAISFTTIGADEEVEDEEQQVLQYFGFVKGNIVGIRYYDGMVSNKEMVALVREPFNPYDANAVRVNNIMGQQVGHIKRDMAKALSEVVDGGLASIEGLVPYGANNVYTMAVEISFWGDPANRERTVRIMRSRGFHVMTEHPKAQKSQKGYSQQQQVYTQARSSATNITANQMKYELDGLFERLKDVDQSVEEEACPAISSRLYQHQKQAVAWMRKRELGSDLPPFWEERKPTAKIAAKAHGRTVYHNTVTNFMTTDQPETVRGGILADDMGLGKTLITISLILGNSWNGKPMHTLVSGKIDPDLNTDEVKLEKASGDVIDLTEHNGDDVPVGNEVTVEVEHDSKDMAVSNEVTVEVEHCSIDVPIVNNEVTVQVLSEKVEQVATSVENVEKMDTEENGRKRPRRLRASKRPARYVEEPEIEFEEEGAKENETKKVSKRKKTKSKVATQDDEYVPCETAKPNPTQPYNLKKSAVVKKADASHLLFAKEPVPSNQQPHATLIVCPLSLIGNWVGQIEEHVHSTAEVKILVYHGPVKAQVNGKMLAQQDVVVTTYQTLALEMKKSKNTLLFKTKWLRVVLDEGHIIRNPKARQTAACKGLNTERKWVLTGTPIQNSTKDLFSIISFLGVDPFTDAEWWKRTIERPINNGDPNALKRIRCLLGAICMRRTKQQKVNGKPIISMPPREVLLQSIDLSDEERKLYAKMDIASKQAMKSFDSEGLQTTRYADILVFIMRLRQICCHPSLAKGALKALSDGGCITKKEQEQATKLFCMMEAGVVDDCCVCLDAVTMPVITLCSHVFCKLCICGVIASCIRSSTVPKCPLCRNAIREEELVDPPVENEGAEKPEIVSATQHSSKINALMFELLKLDREKPDVKSLVVSQFTEYLKIIQGHLVASNIPCVIYHGGMTRKAREDAIWQLQSGCAKVMLLTLKAGGVGLNLTAASQVFLMEPAWNPAAEDQCFDRVYRLGQVKPVRIVKFVCSNTVEERVMKMQARKRELAKASLQRRTAEERKQLRADELRGLMDL